jgi:hypothetical protein
VPWVLDDAGDLDLEVVAAERRGHSLDAAGPIGRARRLEDALVQGRGFVARPALACRRFSGSQSRNGGLGLAGMWRIYGRRC